MKNPAPLRRFPFLSFMAALAVLPCWIPAGAPAQPTDDKKENAEASKEKPASDKTSAGKLELEFEGPVSPELAGVAADLTKRFYVDYPKLLERFDQEEKPAPRRIRILFDENLKIPAHYSGNTVTVGVKWLTDNPHDTPLLTHELTHAVQQYPRPNPGWLTEGIADYARHLYGPNPQQNWKLPDRFRPGQSYKEGYRVTGKFLLWVDEKHPGTVDKLHQALQAGKYQTDLWKTATGKTADDLWKECLEELRPVAD